MTRTKAKPPTIPRKNRKSRAETGIELRASTELRTLIESWAAKRADKPSLSEAVRRLAERGLVTAQSNRRTSPKAAAKASAMAGTQIDHLSDRSAPLEEQEKRKRRLLKGPSEFRDIRKDHY